MKPSASSIRPHACATRCCATPARSQREQVSETDAITTVARTMAGAEKRSARSFNTWVWSLNYRISISDILLAAGGSSCKLCGGRMTAIMKKSQCLAIACALLFGCASTFAQKKGDAAKGKDVFDQCSVCHNADSTEKKMGPGLKGLFKKAKLNNGKPVTEANVKALINAGGNGMPAYADMLSDEERADVNAYLKTL